MAAAPALASERSWSSELQLREWALIAATAGALVWLLPKFHLALFAGLAVGAFAIGSTPFRRNVKMALILSGLAVFLVLGHWRLRPGLPHVLWSGYGIEVFLILRVIDYAVSKPPRAHAGSVLDRFGRCLLYLFFLPTLFSGPTPTYRDFFAAYQPDDLGRWRTMPWHVALTLWGAVKFYLSGGLIYFEHSLERVSIKMLGFARSPDARDPAFLPDYLYGPISALPDGALPMLLLWGYVALYLVFLYFAFSGFCDMAVGVSRILGFNLYKNFHHPLFARSPIQYWKSWNISAYKWLMTHVFYPYWGHTQVPLKILTVFLVSGLWHLVGSTHVTLDAAIQLFTAVTLYGMAVTLIVILSGTWLGRVLSVRGGLRGAVIAIPQIILTFVFTALVHQIFWAGMTNAPLEQNVLLFKQLFAGIEPATW